MVDVHARDVVTLLKTSGVTKDTDFEWLCQLRYSLIDGAVWFPNSTPFICMILRTAALMLANYSACMVLG